MGIFTSVRPPRSSQTGRPVDLPNISQHAISNAAFACSWPSNAPSMTSLIRSTLRGSRPMSLGAISAIPVRTPKAWDAMKVAPNGVLSPQPSSPHSVIMRTNVPSKVGYSRPPERYYIPPEYGMSSWNTSIRLIFIAILFCPFSQLY